jgi:V8-like Glu-specific endopeptidase
MGPHTYVVTEPRLESEVDSLLGMMGDDADGSLWQVSSVDLPEVRAIMARRDAQSPEVARGLTIDDPTRRRTAPAARVGSEIMVYPMSWTRGDCDNSGGALATPLDNHYWIGDDDRVAVVPTASSRRKTMVDVRVDGGTVCSGVILRRDWVLTNAHCIFDADRNLVDIDSMTVVRWDGVDSTPEYELAARRWPSSFAPLTDPGDDWALLKLDTLLQTPFFDMDISGASDSTLGAITNPTNLAFPRFAPYCTDNASSGVVENLFVNSAGGLGSIFDKKVFIQMDAGPGHSGSPVFFCPEGDDNECVDDEKGFVIALIADWDGFDTTFTGPKGPSFRTSATIVMDTE